MRNSNFSCFQSPSYCEFAFITCERRTFKFLFIILTVAGHLLGIVLPGSRSPRAPEHGSPVMQDFPMHWGPGDHMHWIWEDSWDPSSLELMWNSLSLPPHTWVPGMLCHKHLLDSLPPEGSVPSSCLSSNQTSLFYLRLLSELLQRSSWSRARRREPLAAPGEERGAGYDDVELSALGTPPVTFSWCCIKYKMKPQIF